MMNKIRDDRQLRALTGLGYAEFERLLPVFSAVYEGERQKRYEQAVQAGMRRRKPGGGRKSKLPTMADKLLFVLYYYKVYPTFDQLGTQFDLVRSKAHARLYELSPLLHETLVRLEMHRRHVEQRRQEMAQDAQTTLAAFRLGQFSPQPVQAVIDELRAALHEPDEADEA